MTEILAPILMDIQRSKANHKTGLKKMVNAVDKSDNKPEFIKNFMLTYYDKVLLSTKKDASVQRVMAFFSEFTSSIALGNDESKFTVILDHLFLRTKAENKLIRLRACETISGIFSSLSEEAEISNSFWKSAQVNMLPLLRDKCPKVRAAAIKAVPRIQNFNEENDPNAKTEVIKDLLRLMASDPLKDIRVAAIEAISIKKCTLSNIVKRLEDVAPEVRKATMLKLMDPQLTVRHLPMEMRTSIVKYGLSDRDSEVSGAAEKLIMKWLEQLGHNVVRLLKLFNFYENEKELHSLVLTIMTEIDRGKSYTTQLAETVFFQPIDQWDVSSKKGDSALAPADIFWLISRCEYSKLNWSAQNHATLLDTVVPKMKKIVKQLKAIQQNKLYFDETGNGISLFRWLLRLTNFVEADNEANAQLQQLCMELIFDVCIPDALVDDILSCLSKSLFSSTSTDEENENSATSVKSEFELFEKVIEICETLRMKAESIEDEDENTAFTIRSLQLTSWILRRGNGGKSEGNELFAKVNPWIIDAVQQPSVDLRSLGIRCLGLFAVSEEQFFAEYTELLNQVVSNTSEDVTIRMVALQGAIDACLVHCSPTETDETKKQFKANQVHSLVISLYRVFSSRDPLLLPIASEGAVKLLFSGITSDSRLCGCLLKQFFSNSIPQVNEDEESTVREVSRLQQIFSVFFHSFHIISIERFRIIAASLSQVMEEVLSEARVQIDAEDDVISIQMISEKLIALSLQITNTVSSKEKEKLQGILPTFYLNLFASNVKEILKYGSACNAHNSNHKQEKFLLKDMVKSIAAISKYSSFWVNAANAEDAVLSLDAVISTISGYLDRLTLKSLTSVRDTLALNISSESVDSEGSSQFFASANGLQDLVNLTLGIDNCDDVSSVGGENRVITKTDAKKALRKAATSTTRPRRNTARKAVESAESNDEEDEQSDDSFTE